MTSTSPYESLIDNEESFDASTEDVIVFPTSFAQQRLWFLDQLMPGSVAYHLPSVVQLAGRLNLAALEQTFTEIRRRHESLRTTFAIMDGSPVQIINPPEPFALPLVDLRHLPEQERPAQVKRLAGDEAARPFDLERGTLLRVSVLRLKEDEHVLLLTMHHIISDGWSLGILTSEVATLYAAFNVGASSPLPELPIQYADYAHWQREWFQGEVLEAQLSYWRRQLADAPPGLELPPDRLRSIAPTFRSATQTIRLSVELSEELRSLGQREGVTLFITLLAAFKILLYRYTGQPDVLVGTPIAGRNRAEVEGLIGFFVNTLVLRTDLGGNPDFQELLGRVREVALSAYAHQDLPFEKLVEELQPGRDLSRTPLFQVMMVFQNAPTAAKEGFEVPGLHLNSLGARSATTQFDLTLAGTDTAQGLVISVEYQADLYNDSTITRLLEHFQCLLQGIVSRPAQRLSELPLMSEQERRQLLVEWNDTAREFPSQRCLPELFEAQVERTPYQLAVIFEDVSLSYLELNRRANKLAHHLRERGVGPELLVAVLMHRSIEMVVSLLAILKAGGAYVPLDPSYPQQRLSFMLEDAQARVLLTEQSLLERVPPTDAHVICLDTEWAQVDRQSERNLQSTLNSSNLAYVIYTSGSTGQPKGVEVSHAALSNLIYWHQEQYHLSPEARATQVAGQSFDASVWELWPYLTAGGSVYLLDEETLLSTSKLWRSLDSNSITHCFLPTPLAETLLSHLDSSDEQLPATTTLRYLLTGGDKLARRPLKSLPFELVNHYGPTENTVVSTFAPVTTLAHAASFAPPIGKPISNTRAYVLDRHLQVVPQGVVGELYVGGSSLARGYRRRAATTAERFCPDPFRSAPGERMYRTGDLVRLSVDGNLEFIGREDQQVKVRGFRIELGEIEAALSTHPSVEQVIVITRTDPGSEKRLVAYVVTAGELVLSTSELRRHLQERLPDYMLPSAFVQLEELPLTENGKVDRRALPAPTGERPELASSYVEARTPVEERLVEMWKELLRVEQVGVEDNFFQLGGHSLLATQVISRLRKEFAVELQLRRIFEHPTVAGLADCIEIAMRSGQALEAPPIERIYREEALSLVQQRLWLLEQLKPGSAAYHLSVALSLNGQLAIPALERAFDRVIQRQESLRTTFTVRDGNPIQVINPPQPLSLSLIDLSALPKEWLDDEAARLTSAMSRRAFDLEHGPLLRAHALRLGESEFILLITMHHLIGDEHSLNILTREVAAYIPHASEAVTAEAVSAEVSASLLELPIQYADFAQQERERLQGDALEAQLDYWKQQLAGVSPVLDLPTDRPRPPMMTFSGAALSFIIPGEITKGLRALGQRDDASLFMILLAAFKSLLYRYTGQEDIITGSTVSNRHWPGTENVIGHFVNALVLRTDMSGNPGFRELLRRVREVVSGAYANQDVPFETLLEELKPERDLSRPPIFQVMFEYQTAPRPSLSLPFHGLTTALMETSCEATKYELSLLITETGEELRGRFEYSTDLFDATTISRLLQHFLNLLQAISAHPDQRLSQLPLLSDADLQQLLRDFNSTAAPFADHSCIHHLFQSQAARSPLSIALSCASQQLSYQQLNERANQLARYLRGRGVGQETLVGICMKRSVEMVVAVLGVMKAGGAYVPLDAQYPAERLRMMVEDAGVELVLVNGAEESERVGGMGREVLDMEEERAEIDVESEEDVQAVEEAGQLAYVIYTSGSTGIPKGVCCSHVGVINLLADFESRQPLAPVDECSVWTSLSFDVSVYEIFSPLLAGATLNVVPDEVRSDSRSYFDWLGAERITSAYVPPFMLRELSEWLNEPQKRLSMRRLLVGVEPIPESLLGEIMAKMPGLKIINGYGPTETSICATLFEVPLGTTSQRITPIGQPVRNTQAFVLDEFQQPVPVGVAGELYLGGAGVARSYLHRPSLTADKFVPHPFSLIPGSRLYRTGDRARFLPSGLLHFLGRFDHQVKVRGFRIELGEIEALLSAHSDVEAVVVLAREQGAGEKQLVAYVVAAADSQPSVSELRRHLQERVPDYMLPSAFVMLSEMPLTASGKVDRRALPAPTGERPEMESTYVEARTPVEASVAEMWREVLRVERVGVEDNFFELGGHSLLATQIISRMREAFQVEIALHQFFEHPRVSELAQLVEMTDRNRRSDFEEIARALEAVEGLSEEELQAFLEDGLNL
jgi:amino acid adenylation domain-containing protein